MCHESIRQLSVRILTFDLAQIDHSLRRTTPKLCKAFLMAVRKVVMPEVANRANLPLRIRHWPDCGCTQTDSVDIVSIWLTWGHCFTFNESETVSRPRRLCTKSSCTATIQCSDHCVGPGRVSSTRPNSPAFRRSSCLRARIPPASDSLPKNSRSRIYRLQQSCGFVSHSKDRKTDT